MTPLNSIIHLTNYLKHKLSSAMSSSTSLNLLLDEQSKASDSEEVNMYLEIINTSASFLHFLVLDMLDLLKIQ